MSNNVLNDTAKEQPGDLKLYRPEINYIFTIINILAPIFIIYALYGVLFHIFHTYEAKTYVNELLKNIGFKISSDSALALSACVVLFIFYFLVSLKSILIWFLLLYQKYAPDNLRLACVFKPSCSEYMILALKKYGVIIGICKGLKRLLLCHYPNGGEDYP